MDSEPLLAMLRGAMGNEQAATQLREFLETRITELPAARRDDKGGDRPSNRTRVVDARGCHGRASHRACSRSRQREC